MTAKKAVPAKTKAKSGSMARANAKPSTKAPQSKPYAEGKWAAEFTRAEGERRNWLIKSEPDVFSFDDLLAAKSQTTHWDGVRNSGARKHRYFPRLLPAVSGGYDLVPQALFALSAGTANSAAHCALFAPYSADP